MVFLFVNIKLAYKWLYVINNEFSYKIKIYKFFIECYINNNSKYLL